MRQASRYILHSCEMLYVDTDAFSVSVEDFEQRHLNEICPENKSEQTGHPENGFQRIVIHGTMYTIDRHDNNDYPIKVAPMSGLNVDELVFSRITFASLDGIESINVNKLRFRGCNVTATELLKLERLIKARPSVEIDVGLQKSSVCADNRVRDLFRKYPGIKYRCAPK
ncbi:MAG: hypothetical protein KDK37_15575 [Leptospiraceae bacterium]|nr:hypothetical protein [Leptospiraceae bacterium]